MKKKNKIKKKNIFICLLIIIIITSPIIIKTLPTKHKLSKTEIINNTKQKITDEEITTDFLSWIYDNYNEETILKLNTYLDSETYDINTWHIITGSSYIVLKDLYNNNYDNTSNITYIDGTKDATLSFIGDVSLADNWSIMPKYDERNEKIYGILSKEVVDILTKSTIAVANSEFTVSTRGEPLTGKSYTFRANPSRLSIYKEMGIDLVTLANNHVYDYGTVAFYDMLDSFDEYGIPYIGAGKNIEQAMQPYYFIINGYKIAFLNATRAEKNIKTKEATKNEGGVFRCYDPNNLINLIKETKKDSDYVITLIHWGKEDSHELEQVQLDTSKKYIDAGSDVIIGTHAHALQGIEFYKNKPIIYNLGDFIFNSYKEDTGIFQIKLTDTGQMTYYFIPAIQKNEYTSLLKDSEYHRVIKEMNSWSINAIIDENGEIKLNN